MDSLLLVFTCRTDDGFVAGITKICSVSNALHRVLELRAAGSGFNYRMTDLQAALGLVSPKGLRRLWRKAVSLEIIASCCLVFHFSFLRFHICSSSLHLAVVRITDSNPDLHLHVFEGLRAAGIGVQLHYSPVHLQPYYRRMGFKEGDFPEAEAYACSAISLPLYPGLSTGDQQRVATILSSLLAA